MNIGVIKEDLNKERRIPISPEIVKKLNELGLRVNIQSEVGKHLGFSDKDFSSNGANVEDNAQKILQNSEIILKVGCPSDNEINFLNHKHILIGTFNPLFNKNIIKALKKKNIKIFSLDLLPRITRAQTMDVLSSQANLAGYRAVIESVYEFESLVPMMMTAAGTVPAARVLIIGVGVAGLQAIATAKRLGAIVSATDVRLAAKEQVESLGGKFLSVESSENLETKEGYAKEAGEQFKKKQTELLNNAVKSNNIIICTALIPGKKAPRILTEEMIKVMKPGSIIYDLAVEQGGNCAYSESDKIKNINGVKIIGFKNILNKLPLTASKLYSKNLFSFIQNLYNKEKKEIVINMEDEVVAKTLIKEQI